MRAKNFYFLFGFIVLFTSCGGSKISTKNFVSMNDPSELNGRYINNTERRSLVDMLTENTKQGVDLVNIYSPTKDSLIISFTDIYGYKSIGVKGKMKNNYFEYYLEKTRFCIPLIYCSIQIERVRIGKGIGAKLEVHRFSDHFGMLFVFNSMYSGDYFDLFEPYDTSLKVNLFNIKIDSKWGYRNRTDSIVIAPQYDYAQAFENGLAKVSLNDKWGYIDSTNQVIIPIIYDVIMSPENGLLRVKKDAKWSILNFENKVITSDEYDQIDSFGQNMYGDSLFQKLAKVYKNNKVGFINAKGEEIIPIVYQDIDPSFSYIDNPIKYYRTKIGNRYGYVTGYGVFCEPIFDKVDDYGLKDDHGYDDNDKIVNKIGRYVQVTFKGKPYILGENGMIYPYKKKEAPIISFGKSPTLNVDFDNGIKVGK